MRRQTVQVLGIILFAIGLSLISGGFFMLALSWWMEPWIGGLGALPFFVMAGGAVLASLGGWLTWGRAARE